MSEPTRSPDAASVFEPDLDPPEILDACCGGRQWWWEKDRAGDNE